LGGEPRLYTRGRGSVHVCEFANFKAPGTVHCRHQRHNPPHKPKSHVARLWKPERGFPSQQQTQRPDNATSRFSPTGVNTSHHAAVHTIKPCSDYALVFLQFTFAEVISRRHC
jgi:hypothetical protein